MDFLKLLGVVCGVVLASGAQLPSFITKCSMTQSPEKLSACLTTSSRAAQPIFAKGIPELGIETLDPLTLTDVRAKAGTFALKCTNVLVKGLRKMEIMDFSWNLNKEVGHMKLFGNLTITSDYEADGRVLIIPITGTGKLTVKMYNTDMLLKFKIKKTKKADGKEFIGTSDLKASQKYGLVKMHLSNILGGAAIGDTINQVLNENWRDLMEEVGPPFIKAVSEKVHNIINKFYAQVPANELLDP